MKLSTVTVPWNEGLHARPAARLVLLARTFKARIDLKCGGKIANARNILSLLLLCAAVGTAINLEISGEDEEQAMEAFEGAFKTEHP
jgi:phosphotransferase system HPr (HPr) family protein